MMDDTVTISDAVAVFREAVVPALVQMAVRGEIPAAQIEMRADIVASEFHHALWKRRLTDKEHGDGRG